MGCGIPIVMSPAPTCFWNRAISASQILGINSHFYSAVVPKKFAELTNSLTGQIIKPFCCQRLDFIFGFDIYIYKTIV